MKWKNIERLLDYIEAAEKIGAATLTLEKPFGEIRYELIVALETLKKLEKDNESNISD